MEHRRHRCRTQILADIFVDTESSSPDQLTMVNNTLYFTADDGIKGRELWMSDGTFQGTVLVKDINFGTGSSNPTSLINVGGVLYFAASSGTETELWKSDGRLMELF